MTKPHPHLPAPEDLPRLYLGLRVRIERLEGNVSQFLAEKTKDTLVRPTWRDLEQLKAEITRLQARLGNQE